jgi:hypothetical protein
MAFFSRWQCHLAQKRVEIFMPQWLLTKKGCAMASSRQTGFFELIVERAGVKYRPSVRITWSIVLRLDEYLT